MSQEKTNLRNVTLFLTSIFFLLFLFEFLLIHSFLGNFIYNEYISISGIANFLGENKYILRIIYLTLLTSFVINTPSISKSKNFNKYKICYFILSFITSFFLVLGYLQYNFYNLYIYPFIFFSNIILLSKTLSFAKDNFSDDSIFGISSSHDDISIPIKTTTGKFLYIKNPKRGIYINGNPGSGKSASIIKPILYHCAYYGRAGFVYDYEGDPLYANSPILSKVCYTGIVNGKNALGSKNHKTKFAFLNFTDLSKTVRVNPFSPKYLKSRLDIINVCNILMKNLEPSWREKTDFWANNAINYITGITYMLWKHHPDKISLPLIVATSLQPHDAVLRWLCSDSEVEKIIIPIATAFRQNAEGQIAGATSSAQLPTTKLLDENIFYVLNPTTDAESFDLNITNPSNPMLFCIGMSPTLVEALAPPISVISSVCMKEMNNSGKVPSIFCADEFPSVMFDKIDKFIATSRKHGVSTTLALQDQMQANINYGEKSANVIKTSLANHFYGTTGDYKIAKEVSESLGKIKKTKQSYSESSESNLTKSTSQEKDEVLQIRDIMSQPPGHFTGIIAGGNPPFFHTKFREFFLDNEFNIPAFGSSAQFSSPGESVSNELLERMFNANLKNKVYENYHNILAISDNLVAPYKQSEEEEEEKEN